MKKIANKLKRFDIKDYALYLVSLRVQSYNALREKLERKGYQNEEIDTVINRLTELGYLNDEQFVQIYFENLKKYKHFGYYGIKKKLMDKKIEKKEIEKVLKTFKVKEETEIANRLLDKNKSKSKIQKARMLQSRGFRPDVIMKVI